MTTRQAAERLGISVRTVRRRIATGRLRAVRDGGCIIIRDEDLAAYIARREPWRMTIPTSHRVNVACEFPAVGQP